MGTDQSGAAGTDAKFWDSFLEVVRAQGVRAPYGRWYMIRGRGTSRPIRTRPSQGTGPRR